MITDGSAYIAVLVAVAALIVCLPRFFTGKGAGVFFSFVPPVVLIYLVMMTLCTARVWSLSDTAAAYSAVKNPVLYAMVFLMLLRCDLRRIARLGPEAACGVLFGGGYHRRGVCRISRDFRGRSRGELVEIHGRALRQLDGRGRQYACGAGGA